MIKKLLFIVMLVLGGWYFGRSYIPKEYMSSAPVQYLDVAIKNVEKAFLYVKNIVNPNNIERIVEIEAKQLYGLGEKFKNHKKSVLIYIYSPDSECTICDGNFGTVVDIAREYDEKELTIIAVGIAENRQKIADFLDAVPMGIPFKPIMLKPSDEGEKNILNEMKRLGTSYYSPPYMCVINKNGVLSNITTGVGRDRIIKENIKKALLK